MTGSEIFKRTAAYEREVSSIRLHAPQWKMLLAFDGQRALAEVALGAGVPFSEAMTQTEDFLKKDWIAEQPISLEEYLKRANAGGGYTGGVIPPSVVINDPKPETKSEAKSEFRAEAKAEPKSENGTAPATLVVEPTKENAAPARPMRLSAIVDYIVSLAESIPLGQLLAYRVFLRVPPEILQSEEIVSIHLIDDSSLIRTESLQKAITTAMQEIVRRPLPESVYAAA
jgi:hypothetical protein